MAKSSSVRKRRVSILDKAIKRQTERQPRHRAHHVETRPVRTEWPHGQAGRVDQPELLANLTTLEIRGDLRLLGFCRAGPILLVERIVVPHQLGRFSFATWRDLDLGAIGPTALV